MQSRAANTQNTNKLRSGRPSVANVPFATVSTWTAPFFTQKPSGPSKPIGVKAKSFYIPGSGITAPLKLTAEERAILQENNGCTKCCQIAPGHQGKCNNDVPSGDGYKPVAYLLLNKHTSIPSTDAPSRSSTSTESSTSSTKPSHTFSKRSSTYDHVDHATRKLKTINAIYEDGSSYDSDLPIACIDAGDTSVSDSSDIPVESSRHFRFTHDDAPNVTSSHSRCPFTTTCHPIALHPHQINHTTSHSFQSQRLDPSNESSATSVVSSVNTNQFVWHCKLTSPISDFPVAARTLIDTGAAVVLIKEQLVDSLAIPRKPLAKPLPIHTATNSRKLLTHYVTLSLSSSNLSYAALPVKAIISDSLSNDIILGMPFLEKNNIVVDAAASTVQDKSQKYQLIGKDNNLPPVCKSPKIPTMHNRMTTMRKYRRDLLTDLKQKLRHIKTSLLNHSVAHQPQIVAAALVATRIANIEQESILETERNNILSDFADVFKDLPHADMLPDNVLAEINLKDANKIIQTWTYSCPCKYRDAWQTLIQQHLDAGRIRESSAATASPAFIIPKADPTALPYWVNDYRQLNKNTIPDNTHCPVSITF